MGVATKSRRKLDVNGRQFIWYVCEDYDSPDIVLHVCSQDKRFIVQYPLAKPEHLRFVTVIGPEIGGVPHAGHYYRRFLCPQWEIDGTVTPGSVRRLILWCLSTNEPREEVDWQGRRVENM